MLDQLFTIAEQFEILLANLAALANEHDDNAEIAAHLAVAQALVKSGLEQINRHTGAQTLNGIEHERARRA